MANMTAFTDARPPIPSTGLAGIAAIQQGTQDRYAREDREESQQVKGLAAQAVKLWQKGQKGQFQTILGHIAAIDPSAAKGLMETFGSVDRTNFVEAAYHIYNAANPDKDIQDASLTQALDVLNVRPGHPFAKGLAEIMGMPYGTEEEKKKRLGRILQTLDVAKSWGAFGGYFQEEKKIAAELSGQGLRARDQELRQKEYELDVAKEERMATEGLRDWKLEKEKETRIANEGRIPEGLKKDPNNPDRFISVPGSPQRAERNKQKVSTIRKNADTINKTSRILKQLEKATTDVDWTTSGFVGSVASLIPGTDARDWRSLAMSIRANIGFDALQTMRDNSPTGGALGQVAIQELDALQSSIASLEQSQSPEQLKENLEYVKSHYRRYLYIAEMEQQQLKGLDPDDFWNGLGGIEVEPGKDVVNVAWDKKTGKPVGVEFSDGTRKRF